MADGTLVALHDLHEVGVAVEDLQHRHDRVVSNFHETDLTVDLVPGVQVVSIAIDEGYLECWW